MANFATGCGRRSGSLNRTCPRYSNRNRPLCMPPDPGEITGLQIFASRVREREGAIFTPGICSHRQSLNVTTDVTT